VITLVGSARRAVVADLVAGDAQLLDALDVGAVLAPGERGLGGDDHAAIGIQRADPAEVLLGQRRREGVTHAQAELLADRVRRSTALLPSMTMLVTGPAVSGAPTAKATRTAPVA
jgi:hypothetical protein